MRTSRPGRQGARVGVDNRDVRGRKPMIRRPESAPVSVAAEPSCAVNVNSPVNDAQGTGRDSQKTATGHDWLSGRPHGADSREGRSATRF